MSTHNLCFYGELTKIILQSSVNTHFICSLDKPSQMYRHLPFNPKMTKMNVFKDLLHSKHVGFKITVFVYMFSALYLSVKVKI